MPTDNFSRQSISKVSNQVAPLIWRKLPSIQTNTSSGTATENAARLQAQLNLLAAQGGGILNLVEDIIEIDRPILVPYGVSILGLGQTKTLIKNTYSYQFRQSSVFLPGNFHPAFTGLMLNDSNSKATQPVLAGAMTATLTNSADASGYAVNDIVVFFDSTYYTTGSFKIFNYMAIRKITKISGSVLYVDEPFWDGFTGKAYNLRTGTIQGSNILANGSDTAPNLFVWGGGEIGGFSVDTAGYPISDSAVYKGLFSDINTIRGRTTMAYGNSYQHVTFDNCGGRFMIGCSELSLNSENAISRNFTASYDATAAAALSAELGVTVQFSRACSFQENGIGNRIKNANIDVTGASGGGVMATINAEDCGFDRVVARHRGTSFTGTVLTVGDTAAGGRRAAKNTSCWIDWSGPCGYYLSVTDHTGGYFDGVFRGTPAFNAADIRSAYPNTYAPGLSLGSGKFTLTSTAVNQNVNGYIDGGITALDGGDYTKLGSNLIRNIRSAKTAKRNACNIDISSSVTVGTSETDITVANLGVNPLRYSDMIEFTIRILTSGTAGTKTVYVRLIDNTTPTTYTPIQFNIPATVTGNFYLKGRLNVQTLARYFPEGWLGTGAGVTTVTESQVSADLSAKDLTLKISAIKANSGDTVSIQQARMYISNPIEL